MYGPTPPVPPSASPTPPYAQPGPYAAHPPTGPAYSGHPSTPGGYAAYPAPSGHPGLDHPGFDHPGFDHPGYGAAPSLPPRRSTAARVGLFAMRAVLACVPLATIGILSWVPLLRPAFVRRRTRDWAALGVTAVLSFSAFVAVGSSGSDDSLQATVGMATLLGLVVASTVYFLVAELRTPPTARPVPLPQPYAPQWPAVPTPLGPLTPTSTPATPLVPLGQVQAELDELSALLRRHERLAP